MLETTPFVRLNPRAAAAAAVSCLILLWKGQRFSEKADVSRDKAAIRCDGR